MDSQPHPRPLSPCLLCFCLSLLGDDVPGGEEAGPQGPGGPERAGKVAQSHQNHRLWPGAAAGRRREGVQRRRGQGWCKWRHIPYTKSKYCDRKVIKQKVSAGGEGRWQRCRSETIFVLPRFLRLHQR